MPKPSFLTSPKFVTRVSRFCKPLFPNSEKAMSEGFERFDELPEGERTYILAMVQAQTVIGLGHVVKLLEKQNALLAQIAQGQEPDDEEDEDDEYGEDDEDDGDDEDDEDDVQEEPPPKPPAKPRPAPAAKPPAAPTPARARPRKPQATPQLEAVVPDEVIVPNG